MPLTARKCGWRFEWLTGKHGESIACGHRLQCVQNGRALEELEIHNHPDGSAWVVVSSDGSATSDAASRALLLQEGQKPGFTHDATFLRCLIPIGSRWESSLTESGFHAVDNLTAWRSTTNVSLDLFNENNDLRIVHTSGERLTDRTLCCELRPQNIRPVSSDAAVVEIDRDLLLTMLNQALGDSQDLAAVQAADGEKMTLLWSLLEQHVDVFVALSNQIPTGIAVTSRSSASDRITVEYCGVIPTQRRHGIGTAVVHAAQRWLMSAGKPTGITFEAIAASTNATAAAFYRQLRFQPFPAGRLWMHHA